MARRKFDLFAPIDEAVAALRERISEAVASASMPEKSSITLGRLIKRRRETLKLSLEDVAQAAGCTKSHVWEMEQDRSRNPTVAMVHGLAIALSVPFPIMAQAALATVLAMRDAP